MPPPRCPDPPNVRFAPGTVRHTGQQFLYPDDHDPSAVSWSAHRADDLLLEREKPGGAIRIPWAARLGGEHGRQPGSHLAHRGVRTLVRHTGPGSGSMGHKRSAAPPVQLHWPLDVSPRLPAPPLRVGPWSNPSEPKAPFAMVGAVLVCSQGVRLHALRGGHFHWPSDAAIRRGPSGSLRAQTSLTAPTPARLRPPGGRDTCLQEPPLPGVSTQRRTLRYALSTPGSPVPPWRRRPGVSLCACQN